MYKFYLKKKVCTNFIKKKYVQILFKKIVCTNFIKKKVRTNFILKKSMYKFYLIKLQTTTKRHDLRTGDKYKRAHVVYVTAFPVN